MGEVASKTTQRFEGTDPDVLARDCVAADASYGVPLGRDEAGESHVRDLAFDETNPVSAEPDVGVCDPMLGKFVVRNAKARHRAKPWWRAFSC